MIMADIPIARPVDVRPRHDAPFGLDRFAISIGGQAIGHLFGQIENEGDLRAAPGGDLAVRVPAAGIGSLNRWPVVVALLQDHSAQFRIARLGALELPDAATGVANNPRTATFIRLRLIAYLRRRQSIALSAGWGGLRTTAYARPYIPDMKAKYVQLVKNRKLTKVALTRSREGSSSSQIPS